MLGANIIFWHNRLKPAGLFHISGLSSSWLLKSSLIFLNMFPRDGSRFPVMHVSQIFLDVQRGRPNGFNHGLLFFEVFKTKKNARLILIIKKGHTISSTLCINIPCGVTKNHLYQHLNIKQRELPLKIHRHETCACHTFPARLFRGAARDPGFMN